MLQKGSDSNLPVSLIACFILHGHVENGVLIFVVFSSEQEDCGYSSFLWTGNMSDQMANGGLKLKIEKINVSDIISLLGVSTKAS